jgi:hypothetical protein
MAGLPMTLPAATHRACPIRMARESFARRNASMISSTVNVVDKDDPRVAEAATEPQADFVQVKQGQWSV